MALSCSSCNFSKFSLQSHRKFSISEPLTTKRVFIIFPSPLISKPSIFFNPFLHIPIAALAQAQIFHKSPVRKFLQKPLFLEKGLAKSTSQGSLENAFSRFGDVSRVKIIIDKKTGKSLGFAYVWSSSEEFALRAVEEMNGQFFPSSFSRAGLYLLQLQDMGLAKLQLNRNLTNFSQTHFGLPELFES